MYNQLYYGTRNHLNLRIATLCIVIGINILLPLVASGTAIQGIGTGFAFLAILCINIYASFSNINRLFSAPSGYLTLLAPVPSWKTLLGHIISNTILSLVSITIGTLGVMAQTVTPHHTAVGVSVSRYWWVMTAIMLVWSAMPLLAFALWRAISKSVFYRLPLQKLLSAICTIIFLIITNWFYLLLAPFGTVERYRWFFTVMLPSNQLSAILLFAVTLLQAAAILFATAYLMDRRINL